MSTETCGCDDTVGLICAIHTNPLQPYHHPAGMVAYAIKDSGERQQFESGMQRDVTTGKIDYSLVFDGPMLKRWAEHLTNGARKYQIRNWMQAAGLEELTRFRESAARHFCQAMACETDEDHFAAVYFNLNGWAYVLDKLRARQT